MVFFAPRSLAHCRAPAPPRCWRSALALPGCAEMSDSVSLAFADPAKYDLYDCKQLEPERKRLADRSAELQGLMAKAETGAAALSWRRSPIATSISPCAASPSLPSRPGRSNRCRETLPGAAMPVAPPSPRNRAAVARGTIGVLSRTRFLVDAFSSREPVPTSLENAIKRASRRSSPAATAFACRRVCG